MAKNVPQWIGHGRSLVLLLLILAIGLVPAVPALAQQPQKGGTFIVASEAEPAILNSYNNTGATVLYATTNIYNFLVTIDSNLKPRPDLAESWTVSADARTYTFKLVKNATWHDGKPFTSADVAFTLDKILATHPRVDIWWKPNVEAVEAPDDYTVVVRLKSPFAPFLTVMGFPSVGPQMYPKHIWEGTDLKTNPANNKPIGTGPFKLKEWVKGQHLELVRHDKYFKPGLPYLDRLVIQFLPDTAARMLAFEKGEVDFLNYYVVAYDQVPQLRQKSNVVVDERGGEGAAVLQFLLINLRHPILGKREVRQAIATALNKEDIRGKAVSGMGKTADTVVHSGVAWAFATEVPKYPYNVEKANQMLDQAGYPKGADGTRFKLSLSWAVGRDIEGLATEVIRDNLRAVGIQVEIKKIDRPTFLDEVWMKWNFDMAMHWLTTGPDPTVSVTRSYHSKQIIKATAVNGTGYVNPEVDKLLDLEFKQTDPKERAQTWHKVQQIVMTDLPVIPLFELPVVNVYSARVKGIINSAFGQYESHEQVWIAQPGAPTAAAAAPAQPTSRPQAATQPAAAQGGDNTGLIVGGFVVLAILGGLGVFVIRRRM